VPWIRSARTIKRLRRLAVHQYVESPIVRDDRVETQAAVHHVDQPVGRSDGVVSVSAEDFLPSSPKLHGGLRVYGVGANLTVRRIVARLPGLILTRLVSRPPWLRP
jgi:hypothetical protein